MQDKQKVTLYLSPELHRKLKIRSAVDSEPMSTIAQRAIVFYLEHPEIVESIEENYGTTHQVYNCPECAHPAIVKDGEMVSLANQPGILVEDEVSVAPVNSSVESEQAREVETLVTC
ncbi:hypothetical protein IQ235_18125 [Oscillatoriales cyanobacterium LEGE 11467]|uniref:Uncharacterized protein n=1 Tax=Zarconia navalis LEGE 11467 TaxID=1828826 RepID=A0A928VYY6_9CYAN|nr:hypothetical protein [Zarconia navalis]MBE9042681.1 hypothetical protein [Zarconia navalis LEGE 11467]